MDESTFALAVGALVLRLSGRATKLDLGYLQVVMDHVLASSPAKGTISREIRGYLTASPLKTPTAPALSSDQRLLLFASACGALLHGQKRGAPVPPGIARLGALLEIPHVLQSKVCERVQGALAYLELPQGRSWISLYFEPPDLLRTAIGALVQAEGAALRHEQIGGGIADTEPKPLIGLRPQQYEHDLDRRALEQVRNQTGFALLSDGLAKIGLEEAFRVEQLSSMVRVSEKQFGSLHKEFRACAKILDIIEPPDLYLRSGLFDGIQTGGVTKPYITMTSGAVSLLSPAELRFVLGHELGHVKSAHFRYQTLARSFQVVIDALGAATMGLAKIVGTGFELGLLTWQRNAELTADRSGLLACQDEKAAMSALIRLAGCPPSLSGEMNVEAFLAQAEEFDSLNTAVMARLTKAMNVISQDHPWTVVRARELSSWVKTGSYTRLLESFAVTSVPIHESVAASTNPAKDQPPAEITDAITTMSPVASIDPPIQDRSGGTSCPGCGMRVELPPPTTTTKTECPSCKAIIVRDAFQAEPWILQTQVTSMAKREELHGQPAVPETKSDPQGVQAPKTVQLDGGESVVRSSSTAFVSAGWLSTSSEPQRISVFLTNKRLIFEPAADAMVTLTKVAAVAASVVGGALVGNPIVAGVGVRHSLKSLSKLDEPLVVLLTAVRRFERAETSARQPFIRVTLGEETICFLPTVKHSFALTNQTDIDGWSTSLAAVLDLKEGKERQS